MAGGGGGSSRHVGHRVVIDGNSLPAGETPRAHSALKTAGKPADPGKGGIEGHAPQTPEYDAKSIHLSIFYENKITFI